VEEQGVEEPAAAGLLLTAIPWPLGSRTMPHYVLHHNEKREFCVELRSPQGAVLLDCVCFVTHAEALVGITNVRALAPFESRYLRIDARDLPPTFALRDYMERKVGDGAEHPSPSARDEAISACRRFGPVARLVDETDGPGAVARR